MKNKRLLKVLSVLALGFQGEAASLAEGYELPDQKLIVALPVVSYERKTFSRTDSGVIPVGFAAEYAFFLTDTSSLFGQFELNLDSNSQSISFIGGGAGMAWYILGGANIEYEGIFIDSISKPKQNLFLGLGLASRQFDFLIKDTEQEQADGAKVIQRDKKDQPTGSFIGAMLSLGYEYPIEYDLLPGVRAQYIRSFSSDISPDFTIIELWMSLGFIF